MYNSIKNITPQVADARGAEDGGRRSRQTCQTGRFLLSVGYGAKALGISLQRWVPTKKMVVPATTERGDRRAWHLPEGWTCQEASYLRAGSSRCPPSKLLLESDSFGDMPSDIFVIPQTHVRMTWERLPNHSMGPHTVRRGQGRHVRLMP